MPTKTALASPEEPKRPRKTGRTRANNEGSIFPYKNGWAGYVWVTTPEGKKTRKWAYGKTREETHEKWLQLHEKSRKGPVPTKNPTVAVFLSRWLEEVIKPNREPTTYVAYEPLVRLYIIPGLGTKRLDKLTVRDVQTWLNTCPPSAPAAIRRRTTNGPNTSAGAVRSASAARATRPAAPSRASGESCAPPSAMPCGRN
jgi:hypothetical protein